MNKKIVITIALAASVTGIIYGKSAQELRNEEQLLYDKLVEHWIDKEGTTNLGNKELDPKAIQFSLSKKIMEKQTVKQITDSMNTPLKKFTPDQRQDFKDAVQPELNDLAAVRDELKQKQDQLDAMADIIAIALGKTRQDILKLPDENIRRLLTKLPDAKKTAVYNSVNMQDFNNLRIDLGVQTVATPLKTAGAGAAEAETEEGAGVEKKPSKVAAAAAVVAETKTKLSSIIKAASEAAIYAPCGDLHFDIIEDEEGIKFLRLIK